MRLLILVIGVQLLVDLNAQQLESEEELPSVKNKRQLAFGNATPGTQQPTDLAQHNYHHQQQISYNSRPRLAHGLGSPLQYQNVIHFTDPAMSIQNFTAARTFHPLRHEFGLGPVSLQELSMFFMPNMMVTDAEHQHLHEDTLRGREEQARTAQAAVDYRPKEQQNVANPGSAGYANTGPHTFPAVEERRNNEENSNKNNPHDEQNINNNEIQARSLPVQSMLVLPPFSPVPPMLPMLPHFPYTHLINSNHLNPQIRPDNVPIHAGTAQYQHPPSHPHPQPQPKSPLQPSPSAYAQPQIQPHADPYPHSQIQSAPPPQQQSHTQPYSHAVPQHHLTSPSTARQVLPHNLFQPYLHQYPAGSSHPYQSHHQNQQHQVQPSQHQQQTPQHFLPSQHFSQLGAPFQPSPFLGYRQEENSLLKRAPLYTEAHARPSQPQQNQYYPQNHYADPNGSTGRYHNYAVKPIYEESHEKQAPAGGNSLYGYYRS